MRRCWSVILGFILGGGLTCFPGPAMAQADIVLPEGFSCQVYVNNIALPRSLAFDSQGYLYVTHDQVIPGETYQISRVSPLDRSVTTFGLSLYDPDAIVIDVRDNVILGSGSGVLYRLSPEEDVTRITSPLLGNICSLAIDDYGWLQPRGTLLVGNAQSFYDIVTIDPNDQVAQYVSSPDFDIPYSMVFDDVDALFVVEYTDGIQGLYRVDDQKNIQLVASFPAPISIAFNRNQQLLYVGDIEDQRIYQVTLDGHKSVFAENITAYGLTFGPDDCLYVADRGDSSSRILRITGFPAPLPATIDLEPDLIRVTNNKEAVSEPQLNEYLQAYITLPRGYPVANIDVNTITLSLHHLVLANAEDPVINEGTMQVCFPLTLETIRTIVGTEILSFGVEASDRSIHTTSAESLPYGRNLTVLEVFGRGKDGRAFRGNDAIRMVSAPSQP